MKVALFTILVGLSAAPVAAFDVALDVGHHTENPGVISAAGVTELAYNRLLALEVAALLQQAGISRQLIGDDGKMRELRDRTKAARLDRLLVSFHHDSVRLAWRPQVHRFRGYSLFVSRKNPNSERSLACARSVGKHLQQSGFQPSRYHALPVEGENRPFADEALGVHFYDDLVVLKTARQPALLLEAGVIVNPLDEIEVTSRRGRQRLAQAVIEGVKTCLIN